MEGERIQVLVFRAEKFQQDSYCYKDSNNQENDNENGVYLLRYCVYPASECCTLYKKP